MSLIEHAQQVNQIHSDKRRALMLINIQIAVGIAAIIVLLFNYPQ